MVLGIEWETYMVRVRSENTGKRENTIYFRVYIAKVSPMVCPRICIAWSGYAKYVWDSNSLCLGYGLLF